MALDSVSIKSQKEWDLYDKWEKIFGALLQRYYNNDPHISMRISTYAREYARNMLSTFTGTVSSHTIPVSELKRCIEGMKKFIRTIDYDEETAKDMKKSDNLSIRFDALLGESYSDFIKVFSSERSVMEDMSCSPETIVEDNISDTVEEFSNSGYKTTLCLPISAFAQGVVGDRFDVGSMLEPHSTGELFGRLGVDCEEVWNDDIRAIIDTIPQGLDVLTLATDSLKDFEEKHFALARDPDATFTGATLQKLGAEFKKRKIRPQCPKGWYASPRCE